MDPFASKYYGVRPCTAGWSRGSETPQSHPDVGAHAWIHTKGHRMTGMLHFRLESHEVPGDELNEGRRSYDEVWVCIKEPCRWHPGHFTCILSKASRSTLAVVTPNKCVGGVCGRSNRPQQGQSHQTNVRLVDAKLRAGACAGRRIGSYMPTVVWCMSPHGRGTNPAEFQPMWELVCGGMENGCHALVCGHG